MNNWSHEKVIMWPKHQKPQLLLVIIFLTDIYAILNPFNLAIFSRFTEISYAAKLFWDATFFFFKGVGKACSRNSEMLPKNSHQAEFWLRSTLHTRIQGEK